MPTFSDTITPMLWFDGQAEEAARQYVSIFPDSSIGAVSRQPDGTPLVVEFSLSGHRFTALNGGPEYTFSPAVSLVVECADQAEVDYYWDRLTEGGQEVACGWLTDKYGLSWQIVPTAFLEMLSDPDQEKVTRTTAAMYTMKKMDIAALERAFAGD